MNAMREPAPRERSVLLARKRDSEVALFLLERAAFWNWMREEHKTLGTRY